MDTVTLVLAASSAQSLRPTGLHMNSLLVLSFFPNLIIFAACDVV